VNPARKPSAVFSKPRFFIPDVMPGSMYMDIMKHLQNKDLKIVVDATKDLLVNVLQYHPFLIKPNNHELGEIFGVKIGNKAHGHHVCQRKCRKRERKTFWYL